MCGRLMCCLTYEHEFYERMKKNLPKIGKKVKTKRGEGKVLRQNILNETLTIALDEGEVEIGINELLPEAGQKKEKRKRG
jgi:cell fate regulator YaaT (PSP1 superfamily)